MRIRNLKTSIQRACLGGALLNNSKYVAIFLAALVQAKLA